MKKSSLSFLVFTAGILLSTSTEATMMKGILCNSPEAAKAMSNFIITANETKYPTLSVLLASFNTDELKCEWIVGDYGPSKVVTTFKRDDGVIMNIESNEVNGIVWYSWMRSKGMNA